MSPSAGPEAVPWVGALVSPSVEGGVCRSVAAQAYRSGREVTLPLALEQGYWWPPVVAWRLPGAGSASVRRSVLTLLWRLGVESEMGLGRPESGSRSGYVAAAFPSTRRWSG